MKIKDRRTFVLTKEEIDLILNCVKSNKKLDRAIRLALFDGKKLKDILKEVEINRRTLQRWLCQASLKSIHKKVTFNILRFTCLIDMLYKGYDSDYITHFFGYSRKSTTLERRSLYGIIPNKLRIKVLQRDDFKCVFCNRNDVPLQIDHILPISKGGKTRLDNLQTLCFKCNNGKKDKIIIKDKQTKQIDKGEEPIKF